MLCKIGQFQLVFMFTLYMLVSMIINLRRSGHKIGRGRKGNGGPITRVMGAPRTLGIDRFRGTIMKTCV
jgi:hypothetical protein